MVAAEEEVVEAVAAAPYKSGHDTDSGNGLRLSHAPVYRQFQRLYYPGARLPGIYDIVHVESPGGRVRPGILTEFRFQLFLQRCRVCGLRKLIFISR